jgi:hypothetical protein
MLQNKILSLEEEKDSLVENNKELNETINQKVKMLKDLKEEALEAKMHRIAMEEIMYNTKSTCFDHLGYGTDIIRYPKTKYFHLRNIGVKIEI